MTSTPTDGIAVLDPAAADEPDLVDAVADLINAVYAVTEAGMLAVDAGQRSRELGHRLIDFVERRAVASGRTTVQLEVLLPRAWTHPSKELLAEWYPRLGYRVVRTGTIDEAYLVLAPQLATACDFVVHHKDSCDRTSSRHRAVELSSRRSGRAWSAATRRSARRS